MDERESVSVTRFGKKIATLVKIKLSLTIA